MAKTPEGAVKSDIKKWLNARGIDSTMPMGSGYGASGVPDFLCCWNGRFLAIEAKAPGKRKNTTVLQDRKLADIRNAGGIAIVVDDVRQLDELEKALEAKL